MQLTKLRIYNVLRRKTATTHNNKTLYNSTSQFSNL